MKLAIVVFVAAVLTVVAVLLCAGLERHTQPVVPKRRRQVRFVFTIAVAVTLVGGAVSAVLGRDVVYFCFLACPVLLAVSYSVIVLTVKEHRKTAIGVIAGVVALCAGLLLLPVFVSSTSELDVELDDGKLSINGNYGEDIMVNEIRSVRLVDAMPQVVIRTNGYSFGGVNLGRFKAKDGATVWLHSYSGKGPFIQITTNDGRECYVNSKDPMQTRRLFARLVSVIGE